MYTIQNLSPALIWKYFYEICQIPRPSKREEKITDYLIRFGEEHKLEYYTDNAGNIVFRKPAFKGMENIKSVVLQSHLDMVGEKNSNVKHDFNKDPIIPFIEEDWIKARGTTLGADDGIGIAAQMAVLVDNNIKHGPVECLFTTDEETGMTGAFGLQPGFIQSEILLNLDSEDEGELFIGCAGGKDTIANIKFKKSHVPENSSAYKIEVKGLKGGHSGDDIEKGLGNSNKILNRFLWEINKTLDLNLALFEGGNLRNAIPREAFAIFTIPTDKKNNLLSAFKQYKDEIKVELFVTEPGLELILSPVETPEYIIDPETRNKLLHSLYCCPHGVYSWSKEIPGLVETSTNLASVKFSDGKIVVTTSQRSSVSSAKKDIANMIESVFRLIDAKIEQTDGYPGWTPNTNSEILGITVNSYKKLFSTEPVVRAIHAGLECGLFLSKYPFLDMISFGPTIKGAHSPDERLHIPSVSKFWDLLIDVLQQIPENK